MSEILRKLSWPLIPILLITSTACQRHVNFGKLEGKPSCAATYSLIDAEGAVQRERASIADTLDKLGRQYFLAHGTMAGPDGAPEMVSLNVYAAELNITYLKTCSDIDAASQRVMSFVNAGNSSSKLPEGVRLVFTSSVEAPFRNTHLMHQRART